MFQLCILKLNDVFLSLHRHRLKNKAKQERERGGQKHCTKLSRQRSFDQRVKKCKVIWRCEYKCVFGINRCDLIEKSWKICDTKKMAQKRDFCCCCYAIKSKLGHIRVKRIAIWQNWWNQHERNEISVWHRFLIPWTNLIDEKLIKFI